MTEPRLGRQCTIKKNGVTIGYARNVTLSGNNTVIDITSLGDEWAKNALGMSSYEISFDYMYTLNNTEQNALESAFFNRTSLTDIAIYVDSTSNYTCDIATDSDANMKVSTWNVTFSNEDVVTVSVTLTGSGPIYKATS